MNNDVNNNINNMTKKQIMLIENRLSCKLIERNALAFTFKSEEISPRFFEFNFRYHEFTAYEKQGYERIPAKLTTKELVNIAGICEYALDW